MTDPQIFAQAQLKINSVITQLHQLLSHSFTIQKQARDLLPDQNDILQQLNPQSIQYKNLVGILAIDTYVNSLIQRMKRFQDIQAIFSVHIQNILSLQRNHQTNFQNVYKRVISSLLSLTQSFSQYSPQSKYSENHLKMLQSASQKYRQQNKQNYDTLILYLRHQNDQLRRRLKDTDLQINNLQLQLQQMVKQQIQNQNQRQYQQLNQIQNKSRINTIQNQIQKQNQNQNSHKNPIVYNLNNNKQILDLKAVIQQLRQQIFQKQQQINRMNQQFSHQINKYNTVFQQMKSQIKQLRSYSNLNHVKEIQRLQTLLIRMREEHQRDQIIIFQLKQQLNIPVNGLSDKNDYYSHNYNHQNFGQSRSSYRGIITGKYENFQNNYNNQFKKSPRDIKMANNNQMLRNSNNLGLESYMNINTMAQNQRMQNSNSRFLNNNHNNRINHNNYINHTHQYQYDNFDQNRVTTNSYLNNQRKKYY